ncbi:hypothetical protein SAMN02745687_00915 [Lachnospiraceae bacterium NK3A20]|nr:hypothetical protein SAMN02745687_00915 [Lachnospiraceae bacterium NK3A20]
MLGEDRDALTCDMAEIYHIFNMKEHPVSFIATLAAGLRENSRIRTEMENRRLPNTDSLLALVFDKLNWLCWTKTKDAQHNKNMPKSLYTLLTEGDKDKVSGFATAEEFEQRRKELLGD